MKNILLFICGMFMLVSSVFADGFDSKFVVGKWQVEYRQALDDNAYLNMKYISVYDANQNITTYGTLTFTYQANLKQYNTSSVRFVNNELILAVYQVVSKGKWQVENNNFIEQSSSVHFFKFDEINAIDMPNAPLDKESMDMIIMMMKAQYEKEKASTYIIKKLTKEKFIVEDGDGIELTMSRID